MSLKTQLITALAAVHAIPKTSAKPSDLPAAPAGVGHRFGPRVSEGGNHPDNWGRSAACAQMVRKNRRLRLRRERFE